MSAGWSPESEDRAPWDTEGSWDAEMPSARDSWADPYRPADDASNEPLGSPAPVVVLAAGGGALAATALGMVLLLLGGVVLALIVGAMVLVGACAVGSVYLRGAR